MDSSSNPVPVEEKTRVVLAPKWLGKRVGRFKLLSLLGQGAMGRVFRAEDTLMQRHVALKLLPRTVKRGKRSVGAEMLIREARAAGSIEHPNAVQIYEINEVGEVYYIAMELLEGGSLRDLVKAAGPLDPSRACLLAAEAAEALAVAHSLGVIHRDVKPANLMLSRSGRCKVVDFGLARVEDPTDLTTFLAESVGTPQFIAPELLRGTPASAQSDIYSLGGTLWYLLTGKPPFEAGTAQELLHKHLDCPLPDLRGIRPMVPRELADALSVALAKDPAHRYSSMDQFAKVLRIHSIPIAGSATNLTGLSGSRSGSLIRPSSPLEEQPPAEEPEQPAKVPAIAVRPKWPLFAGLGAAVALLLIVLGIVFLRPSKASSDRLNVEDGPRPTPAPTANPPAAAPSEPPEVLPRTLVAQWVADDYSSGGNWIDRSQKIVAAPRNSPVLVPEAFNGHPGILLNGKDQYFTIPADDYPISQGNAFTVAVAFKANRASERSRIFWHGMGLVGADIRNISDDWALVFGGQSGSQVVAGAGNFPTKQDGAVHSDDVDLNRTHVAVMTWQFQGKPVNAATISLYVDGSLAAQETKPSEARLKRLPIGLGAMSGEGGAKLFSGMLAEVRIYDDASEDVSSITSHLLRTYTNPRSDGVYNGSDLNNLLHR